MQKLPSSAYVKTAWKNGGGTTREIVADTPVWRLSLAEVARDGPFSHFANMARILTVVEGAGLDLSTPERTLQARPLAPVSFPGDADVTGVLRGGPVQNLNLIYDPGQVTGRVDVLCGVAKMLPPVPDQMSILFAASGHCGVSDLALSRYDCAVWTNATADLVVPEGATALLVGITRHT